MADDIASSRKNFARVRRRVTLLLSLVAVVAGCGLAWGLTGASAESASPAQAGNVTLRLGWTNEPENLNPFVGYMDSDYEIWRMNYSTVFGYDENNGPGPDLATEVPTKENGGISPDGKVWTVHLRSGVKWSDGQPLTAEDVAFTYNYAIENEMATWTTYLRGIDRVEVVDPTTIRMVCSAPKANMDKANIPILPEHVWSHVDPKLAQSSYQVEYPLVGSGPFQVTTFKKGSYVELTRNPYYYGQTPTIDKVIFQMYQNADTMVTDLKNGGIDGAWGIPPAQFKALGSAPGIKAIAYVYYNWDYLEFNCYEKPSSLGNPILRDERFRHAINWAIDRDKLVALAYQGLSKPGYTVLPPDTYFDPDYSWTPSADQKYAFDLAKAGQELTDAGYPLVDGKRVDKQGKPISLRLWAATDDRAGQMEAKLIAGWLDQLGLRINMTFVDPGQLSDSIYNSEKGVWKPDFDMVVWWWIGYFDAGNTMNCFTTRNIGNLNEPCWSDPQYDVLADKQAVTLDTTERQSIIQQLQQTMYEQTPWIVMTHPQQLEAVNTSRWTGWKQMFNGTGPAWNTEGYMGSYLNLKPKTATAQSSSGGSSTGLIVAVVAAVVIVLAVVLIVLRRRRRLAEEDL
jgi:peptide/nickel transport system substrate-binding protein